EIEVVFAGWDVSGYEIPFKHRNLGIVTPQVLADSYAICDMCLVISNTNLSLVPFEVMACNSVAVCSKGANSSWMVNEENSILVDYDPIQIADRMEYYFNHPDELATIRKKGMDFVKGTSWYKEAEKVYASMLKGIEEDEKKLQ
ncbi:MAG: glycosyltransferase, partial [Fusicatenibacter saccharivorans]